MSPSCWCSRVPFRISSCPSRARGCFAVSCEFNDVWTLTLFTKVLALAHSPTSHPCCFTVIASGFESCRRGNHKGWDSQVSRTLRNWFDRVSECYPSLFPLKSLFRNGNVSQGVLSILGELPIVKVRVEDLPALVNNPGMPSLFNHSQMSDSSIPSRYRLA